MSTLRKIKAKLNLLAGSINFVKKALKDEGWMERDPIGYRGTIRAYRAKAKQLQLNHRPQAPKRRRMRNHPRRIK